MTTPGDPIPCLECGAELMEDSNFCPSCGAERIVAPCRYCEEELDPSDSFCGRCGQVVFADENLEAAVREALEKPKGPLTRAAIRKPTELYAPEREIEYLQGLDSAVNLTSLILSDNAISDVSPLASLTNLKRLNLRGNQISDVSPLASLTNLTYLNLDDNQISDVSPLAPLTKLTDLHLEDNPLSQESVDVHVPNLEARGVDVELWSSSQ